MNQSQEVDDARASGRVLPGVDRGLDRHRLVGPGRPGRQMIARSRPQLVVTAVGAGVILIHATVRWTRPCWAASIGRCLDHRVGALAPSEA